MLEFLIKTPQNKLKIKVHSSFLEKDKVVVDKSFFDNMCKEGCVNFNKKYSCPPFSPCFYSLIDKKDGLFVVMFLCELNQIKSTEYNKVRIANVVMKSRIEKLMRFLENKFKTIFLSTGSCRLCKPCKLKLDLPCKYPDKKRYSLESTGVDCKKISKNLFNIEFLWYKNKKAPEYSSVLCGLMCNREEIKNIEIEFEKFIWEIN